MKPKVSVIVPVYNVERYLPQCVESLIHQTLHEIEIILVDDGSTDGSAELCDKLALSDFRVRVFHQKNQGLSGARNTGMQNAAAEWLMFLDGDDWLELDAIESLIEKALPDVELVVGSFYRTYTNGEKQAYPGDITEFNFDMETYGKYLRGTSIATYNSFANLYPEEMRCGPHMNSACFKLYRRDIIHQNGLLMPIKDRIGEDQIFNLIYLQYVTHVYFVNQPIYHYRQRQGSLSHRAYDMCLRIIQHSQCMAEVCAKLNLTDEVQEFVDARACKDISDFMALCAKQRYEEKDFSQIDRLCSEPNHAYAVERIKLCAFSGKKDALVALLLKLHLRHLAYAAVCCLVCHQENGQDHLFV